MPLPRLSVAGPRIVDPQGRPVTLRGVNRSGLEYSRSPIPPEEIDVITGDWRANVIRLPFNQDWALRAVGYLELLDAVIERAAAGGAYTLLDLQWLDAEHPFGPDRQFVPPLPNAETAGTWALLARRYGNNPAVLFDILNEPHDRAREDPHPLYRPDQTAYDDAHHTVSMTEWGPWAELLVDTIRAQAPEAIIFVSGTDWAYNLRGFPLDREGLVYSTHVYPNKGDEWFHAFGFLAPHAPVFAGEFGGLACDVVWGRRLLDYFDQLGIGWTAWSFADRPLLVTRDTLQPTPFGELVKQRLLAGVN